VSRRPAAGRGVAALAVVLLALACAAEPPAGPTPATPRGSLVFEPPRAYVGELVEVEVAVAAPAEHVVLPLALPEQVPGFWLLDARQLPPEGDGGRRVHRTRIRVRAREVGEHRWPDLMATVVSPDGERTPVPIPGHTVEVVSNREAIADRSDPFGLRAPPGAPAAPLRAALLGAAVGAGGVLAALAIARLHRRRRETEPPVPPGEDAAPSFARVREALDAAASRAATEPREAAGAAAAALRAYFGERYRLDLSASTVEELEAREPPLPWQSTWPAFVEILRSLDALRFPAHPGADATERLRSVLARARKLVERTAPRGGHP